MPRCTMEILRGWQTEDPRVGDVRGRGAMLAVELIDPVTGHPDAALTGAVAARARERGVIVLTCGTDSNVIRLLPPLTIPDDLLRRGLAILRDALADPRTAA